MSVSEPKLSGAGRTSRKSASGETKLGQFGAVAARGALLAMAVVTPWAVGGTLPQSAQWLFGALTVAVLGWVVVWRWGRPSAYFAPWAAVPVLLGVSLGLFQLIAWPEWAYPLASPGGQALQQRLSDAELLEQPLAEQKRKTADPAWPSTISLSSADTWRQTAMLALAAAVFLMASRFFNSKSALVWLCTSAALNGALFTFFGLIQQLTWNGKLYWIAEIHLYAQPFAAFVNRNNAGGYLNLCLAAALGMFIWQIDQTEDSPGFIPDSERSKWLNWVFKVAEMLRWRVANINAKQIGALVLCGMIAAGVLSTSSRGAFLAMVGAMVVVVSTTLLVDRKGTGVWVAVVMLALGMGLVGWVGRTDEVQTRMSTLLDAPQNNGRIEHWKASLQAAGQHWTTGGGLGAYRYLYGFYEDQPRTVVFEHAENQFIESIVEGGLPAEVLLWAAVVMVFLAVMRLARNMKREPERGFVLMGVFALSSQIIQGCVDFGLYQPANFVLMALLMGGLCGRAALERRRVDDKAPKGSEPALHWSRAVRQTGAALPIVAVLCLFGVWEAWASTPTALASFAIRRAPVEDRADVDWLNESIKTLEATLERSPENAAAQLQLAELYIERYGLQAPGWLAPYFRLNPADPRLKRPELLHYCVHMLRRQGDAATLKAWRERPEIRDNLLPARQRLLAAQAACPLIPNVQTLLAQLQFTQDDDESDAVDSWIVDGWNRERLYLARARELTPTDPNLAFRVGVAYWNIGLQESSWACWRDALQFRTRHEAELLDYVLGLDPQILVDRILPQDPGYLLRVAAERFREPGQTDRRRALANRAQELIDDQSPLAQGQWFYMRAQLHRVEKEYVQAAKAFERALEQEPGQLAWRVELTQLLLEQNMLDEALRHAQQCAREAPQNDQVYELLRVIRDALLRRQTAAPAPLEPSRDPANPLVPAPKVPETAPVPAPSPTPTPGTPPAAETTVPSPTPPVVPPAETPPAASPPATSPPTKEAPPAETPPTPGFSRSLE